MPLWVYCLHFTSPEASHLLGASRFFMNSNALKGENSLGKLIRLRENICKTRIG